MSNETDDKLPRSLEILWRRANNRRPRGPQQALSLERIVAAAIELADAEGLQALSMARLAERLGCATMSLYRHVTSKDDLLVFMMDTAPGEPPVIDIAVHGWRGGLERWARELRALYYRHPWILQITLSQPPLGPGQLAWHDCGLRTMAGTGLSPHDKLAVTLLILQYVRGEAQLNLSMSQAQEHLDWDSREMQAWYGRTLARLINAERFPALAELSAAGAFEPGDDDASQPTEFDFGLSRILDGVEMLVRR